MDVIVLPAALADAIRAHAAAESPRECCGLLVGDRPDGCTWRAARLVPLPNAAADPLTTFESEPRAMFAAVRGLLAGEAVVAVYHSHPRTAPVPSRRDVAWRYADDTLHVIVGGDGTVRAWRVDDTTVAEVTVVD